MTHWYKIIEKYPVLQDALKYILNNSNSLYLPYHNLNHNLTVMTYCYDNLAFENLLDTPEAIALLVAALFHDFNHSGGKFKDDVNIYNAQKGIFEYTQLNPYNKIQNLDLINRYIEVTQYPYVTDTINIYEQIIRDSDLCQLMEPNFLQLVVLGLKQEMNVGSIKGMLEGQLKFMDSIVYHTKYCKMLQDVKFDKIKEEINFLLKL